MRRPSVIFLNRVYPPGQGATGRLLRDLARAFADEGWHVTVVTTGPHTVRERDGTIRVLRLGAPQRPTGLLGYGWIWLRMMVAALQLPQANLVVTLSDPPMLVLLGQMLKTFKKARHIHWCHDLYPDLLPVLGYKIPAFVLGALKKRARKAMAGADKVIVIGRCMAKYLTYNARGQHPSIDARHITVIPNWPDSELCNLVSGDSSAKPMHAHMEVDVEGFRQHEEQIKAGPRFRVLYAGNIGLAHPVQTILDAATILHDQHPEIEFVFVGSGKRYEALAMERVKRGLDNIRLMPYQPANKLREIMESGDIHLITMKEEAAGMLVPSKLYAALAVQRPSIFIGPAQCETAKVITDFRAGTIVAQGDAETLAAHIRILRLSSEDWFAAHSGAASASAVFRPEESINAWIERAWGVVSADFSAEDVRDMQALDQQPFHMAGE